MRQCALRHFKDIPQCDNIESTITDEIFSINAPLNCDSEHIIYVYTCTLCAKQYVGQTGNSLRQRHTQHRSKFNAQDPQEVLYTHATTHSTSPKFNSYILTPIEKVTDLGPNIQNKFERLRREVAWIDTLQTNMPAGLNTQIWNKFRPKKSSTSDQLVLILPFSKTSNNASTIIKKHLLQLQNDNLDTDQFNFNILTAYSRHKNLKDLLVTSRVN